MEGSGSGMSHKIDKDVLLMSEAELRQEVMRLRSAFDKELNHTGNHRCWVNLLVGSRGGRAIKPLSLCREEFLGNCRRYYDRNQK